MHNAHAKRQNTMLYTQRQHIHGIDV